jgi:hypothetical protein
VVAMVPNHELAGHIPTHRAETQHSASIGPGSNRSMGPHSTSSPCGP